MFGGLFPKPSKAMIEEIKVGFAWNGNWSWF